MVSRKPSQQQGLEDEQEGPLSPEAQGDEGEHPEVPAKVHRLATRKKLKEHIDSSFGRGFYDRILKFGVALNIPESDLADELGTSIGNIEQIKRKYADEIKSLSTTSVICDKLFTDLTKVRLTGIIQSLLDDLSAGLDGMKPSEKIDFLKFSVKFVDSLDSIGNERSMDRVDKKEWSKRLERLQASE